MKQLSILLVVFFLSATLFAQNTTLKLTYDTFMFENSKKKERGSRYSTYLGYTKKVHDFKVMYEKTHTNTFQPPLDKDLIVHKYFAKYGYKLDNHNSFSFGYIYIDDNIMMEVDNGHIYSLGYQYNAFKITQYLSDYKNFNVYQTDMQYKLKKRFDNFSTNMIILGKYIYLDNKDSNPFTKNAQKEYFTAGIKLHAEYETFHFGAGALFGKRVFAVMDDGFRVQHHAMEINKTYMAGVTKDFNPFSLQAKYIYQRATEIPIQNENVLIKNIILQGTYRF
ncbi:hypothetical protein [Sulfurimonas microaerophilic]|uniref:hypothetical protein n=1 Tax=Sulfurimonas microaerophilic TaxID=3058392 RepID=UPI002714EC65|nr:hypothetical protein [Sulfurimonas sp. hsl 1-7]